VESKPKTSSCGAGEDLIPACLLVGSLANPTRGRREGRSSQRLEKVSRKPQPPEGRRDWGPQAVLLLFRTGSDKPWRCYDLLAVRMEMQIYCNVLVPLLMRCLCKSKMCCLWFSLCLGGNEQREAERSLVFLRSLTPNVGVNQCKTGLSCLSSHLFLASLGHWMQSKYWQVLWDGPHLPLKLVSWSQVIRWHSLSLKCFYYFFIFLVGGGEPADLIFKGKGNGANVLYSRNLIIFQLICWFWMLEFGSGTRVIAEQSRSRSVLEKPAWVKYAFSIRGENVNSLGHVKEWGIVGNFQLDGRFHARRKCVLRRYLILICPECFSQAGFGEGLSQIFI